MPQDSSIMITVVVTPTVSRMRARRPPGTSPDKFIGPSSGAEGLEVVAPVHGGEAVGKFRGPGIQDRRVARDRPRSRASSRSPDFRQDLRRGRSRARPGAGREWAANAPSRAALRCRYSAATDSLTTPASNSPPQNLPDDGLVVVEMVEGVEVRHRQTRRGQAAGLQPVAGPGLGRGQGHPRPFRSSDRRQSEPGPVTRTAWNSDRPCALSGATRGTRSVVSPQVTVDPGPQEGGGHFAPAQAVHRILVAGAQPQFVAVGPCAFR